MTRTEKELNWLLNTHAYPTDKELIPLLKTHAYGIDNALPAEILSRIQIWKTS